MSMLYGLTLILTIALFVYLLYAMFRPETF